MRHLAALAATVCLAAPASMAQDAQVCVAALSRLNALLVAGGALPEPITGEVRALGAEDCYIADPTLPGPPQMRVRADAFRFSGRDLQRFAKEGLPPRTLELRLSGVRVTSETGDPLITYLLGVQADRRRADVAIAATWDAAAERLDLTDASVIFAGGDYLRFTARAEGVDLTDFASMGTGLARFSVTEMVTEVRSYGLFESFALIPLGMALLRDTPDPEARVNELKVLGLAEIMTLPDAQFPHASKMALSALLSDMPNPAGTLRIETTAEPGFGLARGMALASAARAPRRLADLWPLLDGVRYDITYERK